MALFAFAVIVGIYWLGDVAPGSWLASADGSWVWFLLGMTLNWVLLQGATGFSIGKALVGIRVVDREGRIPGLGRAAIRTLPLVIEQWGVIGLIAAYRNPDAQRFGDRWAKTFVVLGRPSMELSALAAVTLAATVAAWVKMLR